MKINFHTKNFALSNSEMAYWIDVVKTISILVHQSENRLSMVQAPRQLVVRRYIPQISNHEKSWAKTKLLV